MKKITIVVGGLLVLLGLEAARTIWQEKRYVGLLHSYQDLPELIGKPSEVEEAELQRRLVMGACHLQFARRKFLVAEWLASAIEVVFMSKTDAAWWLENGPSLIRDRGILESLALEGGILPEHLYNGDAPILYV